MAKQGQSQAAAVMDLAGKIYEAAVDPGRWPQFLDAFADATTSDATVIWLHDTANRSPRLHEAGPSFASEVRGAPACGTTYPEHYAYVIRLLQISHAVPEGAVVTSDSIMPHRQWYRTGRRCDRARPAGSAYVLGGPVLKQGSTIAILSSSRDTPYKDRERCLAGRLMPHLRRACLLHWRLASLEVERAGALAALELLPTAVWLLDARGCLLFANAEGRELDRRHDGLWIQHDGSPATADPATQYALRRVVSDAIAACRRRALDRPGGLTIERRQSTFPLQVTVYPVTHGALARDSVVAMFIVDPQRSHSPRIQGLRVLYRLTETEANLAAALCRGESLEDYCGRNGVTANTARTHLKRVLEKTGTHRQAQLVSLMASISAADATRAIGTLPFPRVGSIGAGRA